MSMTHITPTIGRIVWYRGADGSVRAAIVAAVNGPFNLNLHVFGLNSVDIEAGYRSAVTHADPEQEPGCFPSWHWMPYQKQQAEKHANEVARADEPKTRDLAAASGLSFGIALTALKTGQRVARAGWNGKGMFAYLVPANSYPAQTGAAKAFFGEGGMVPYNAYLALKGADDTVSTWAPSGSDALAEDWLIVE
jgi:hypothetical protein